jgi:GntR family transcriptional regulator / MocR family aminotransferase
VLRNLGKKESFQDLSLMSPDGSKELWRWLYRELRAAILDGRLKPGSRMPSTRNLAEQYDISRGTVVVAFDHLRSEGYIKTQVGAGTFVASNLPDDSLSAKRGRERVPGWASKARLSKRGRLASENVPAVPVFHSVGKAFRSYEPALDLFPVDLWSRVAGRVLRHAPRTLYGNGDVRGYLPLRRAIAEYVGSVRGVRCDPDQVIITTGTQPALDLIARMVLDPGDAAWIEDPGYPGIFFALRSAGAKIVPVPVDQEGLDVEWARHRSTDAKLAYVTPANQFPLGVTMSLARRRALLDWAEARAAWVVEDDFDSEYRYSGRPLAALQSLDSAGSVIYVSTFTKILFNALRLGFMVLPPRLVEPFAAARNCIDRHPPTLDQAILAEFILEGHFGHHIRRMRHVYADRMAVLAEAAEQRLGGLLEVVKTVTGMRTVGWLQKGKDDRNVQSKANQQGLELAALSSFTIRHPVRSGLMLGFAGCSPAELRRGVNVLAAILERGQP